MAWIPMYIAEKDLPEISNWLNEDPNIALIVSIGKGMWQAKENFTISNEGTYCLYHKLAGSLPLLAKNNDEEDTVIENPFEGWTELRSGFDESCPYFGPGHTAIFWFNVRLKSNDRIGMSTFEWIGNHYSSLGNSAPDVAKKWWGKLGRWVRKNATKTPRKDTWAKEKPEIYAFQNALNEIQNGAKRSENP